ncbi:ferritin-like domain-containing protein [Amylocystis lapponica]|nr:ferritin-like domain-containing protein [Amylocystis lapponica]
MFRSALALAVTFAALSRAAPTPQPAAPVDDIHIMNFALTLEYVENTFYKQGLAQFDAQAFEDAGFEPWVRGRFEEISSHEATHIAFLRAALGEDAVEPCNYTYPYTDPLSFATLSRTFEGVGAAAYMGATQFISDKDTLLASVSIAETEARQNSWVAAAVQQQQPWDGPFATPLSFSGAYSLAAGFISDCPASNMPLPVIEYPALNVSNATPAYGEIIDIGRGTQNYTAEMSFAWHSGLNTTYTPIVNSTTTVPDALHGTVYGGVVANVSEAAGNATMVTGLTIFQFPFDSYARAGA